MRGYEGGENSLNGNCVTETLRSRGGHCSAQLGQPKAETLDRLKAGTGTPDDIGGACTTLNNPTFFVKFGLEMAPNWGFSALDLATDGAGSGPISDREAPGCPRPCPRWRQMAGKLRPLLAHFERVLEGFWAEIEQFSVYPLWRCCTTWVLPGRRGFAFPARP